MNLEDYVKDLAPELQERARTCSSVEELLAFAKEAKLPLPDEALAAIAGGDSDPENCGNTKCPKCKSKKTTCYKEEDAPGCYLYYWRCNSCSYEWVVHSLDG